MSEEVSLHEVLASLRAEATGIRDKGTLFEELVVRYLKADPLYVQRFEDVMPYAEWSEAPHRDDTGIDLIGIERDSGGVCAIQCKFYDPDRVIEKQHIDSFFTESGKHPFTSRLIVATTDKWSKNAEEALDRQQVEVARIGLRDLEASPVVWTGLHEGRWPNTFSQREKNTLRPHQREAIDAVVRGFETHNRGKLIMACGTGKTFTALKLVEQTVKPGGLVLFLVPSISLISQSLREWSAETTTQMRFLAVCSDTKVGKPIKRFGMTEDISPHDLVIPPTTTARDIVKGGDPSRTPHTVTVVFSTYQSIQVIADAQGLGFPEFDLIICDEAHRTTGVTLAEEDESDFVKVHRNENIRGRRRLYMTATPRIYGEDAKRKAEEGAAVLTSMDDESTYGPEFHRLSFGKAVTAGLLSDYKVIILNVSDAFVSTRLQRQLADENLEINLDDAAKLTGCWNALAKQGHEDDFGTDRDPMKRAVVFTSTIKASKTVEKALDEVSKVLATDAGPGSLLCVTKHVDGTQNALVRAEALAWLRADSGEPDTCRVLTNARCLSEGVDVPALDAVMFLNPRNSIVDVVQSVGRVMRKAEGKTYGYVIIPVVVPADLPPDTVLNDNKRYQIVWEVLRALRAHDERLDAVITTLDPSKRNDRISIFTVPEPATEPGPDTTAAAGTQLTFDLSTSAQWRDAIYARLVKRVGQRMYWKQWAEDVQEVAEHHVTRITALLAIPGSGVQAAFDEFLTGLRGNLNERVTADDAVNMLAQHLVTRPVFEALFEGYDFVGHNAVAQVMERMLSTLDEHNLAQESARLEDFYQSVRDRMASIDDTARLKFVNELYERFFKMAFPTVASQLGIVYTPVEIVDFIIESVGHVLKEEFGASLSEKGVHVLDPFTGTGTFIVRLLQSGLIDPKDLARKYTDELHCNEILLLAYYIATINIEAAYHGIAGGDYVPFPGAILGDTFQMTEHGDTLDTTMFVANNDRMQRQLRLPIRVILGNPPYSVGQGSENDNAKNLAYPTLDSRIRETYAARSTAGLKRNLYDSYIRAFRWASDRIGDSGVVAFVTNGAFIDSNSADGFRKCLLNEFTGVWVFNLRGNARTSGEIRQREAGNVFGEGSRTPVAITLLVKKPDTPPATTIRYRDIGDYLTREEKLEALAEAESVTGVEWEALAPNAEGDWINQRDDSYQDFMPLGDKSGAEEAVFETYSLGVLTARDAWAINFSHTAVAENMGRMIDTYNRERQSFTALRVKGVVAGTDVAVDEYVDRDETHISWTGNLKADLRRDRDAVFLAGRIIPCAYRPFARQWLYFDRQFNERVYQMPRLFPTPEHENVVLSIMGVGAASAHSALVTMHVPEYNLEDKGQCFPLYHYERIEAGDDLFSSEGEVRYERRDAVTDAALARFRAAHGNAVTKEDVFYYVYGVLHSPEYRERYASDLKKMIPRVPVDGPFWDFSRAGRELAKVHLAYETVEPYALGEEWHGKPGSNLRVEKMRFGKRDGKPDKTRIVYNDSLTLTGIPEEAYEYEVNGKPAIEWVTDRYQVKVEPRSGILNDPNAWCDEHDDPRYIVDLVKRIVSVSLETVRIVGGLPQLALGK